MFFTNLFIVSVIIFIIFVIASCVISFNVCECEFFKIFNKICITCAFIGFIGTIVNCYNMNHSQYDKLYNERIELIERSKIVMKCKNENVISDFYFEVENWNKYLENEKRIIEKNGCFWTYHDFRIFTIDTVNLIRMD